MNKIKTRVNPVNLTTPRPEIWDWNLIKNKNKNSRTHKVERFNNIISNDETGKKKTTKNLSQTGLIFKTRVLGYESYLIKAKPETITKKNSQPSKIKKETK